MNNTKVLNIFIFFVVSYYKTFFCSNGRETIFENSFQTDSYDTLPFCISTYCLLQIYLGSLAFTRWKQHSCISIVSGGYDKRLRENVEYLEELENLADREGVSDQVKFITSCSTTERNELLSQCLCVLYTPKVPYNLTSAPHLI